MKVKGLYLALVVLLGLLVSGGILYATYTYTKEPEVAPLPISEVPEPEAEPTVLPYGKVTLALGETAVFKGISIKPIAIVDDSRCPMNAKCIWAGTVRVKTEIVSGLGTSTQVIELGKSITTEAEEVSLLFVAPDTMAGVPLDPSAYRLTFSVSEREPAPPLGKCYVGGCSSQLCSDKPDMVSTCEYHDAYACYQAARCERQATGSCGWTMTPELQYCLASS